VKDVWKPAGQIVICADDFGLHPAVNQAVLELGRLGKLNASSCLVDGPSFAADADALCQLCQLCPKPSDPTTNQSAVFQAGLHLNFTENFSATVRPVQPALPLSKLMRLAWLRRLDAGRLRDEVARQLDRFESIMQRVPDFIDGHQHVHQFPQIRDALVAELQHRYPGRSALWLRSTRCYASRQALRTIPPGTLKHRLKAMMIERLGSRALERKVAARWRMNRALAGVYDFQGGELAYTRLLAHWRATMQAADVLMCHPARHIMPKDPLGAQRLAEYRVLMAADFQT